MAKKQPFQIMHEMNVMDTENKTKLIPISTSFVEGKKCPHGALITMGVEESMLLDLLNETRFAVLVMVDKGTYFKLDKENS